MERIDDITARAAGAADGQAARAAGNDSAGAPGADASNVGAPAFDNAPIGVFDSGFGGLTVAREIAKALP